MKKITSKLSKTPYLVILTVLIAVTVTSAYALTITLGADSTIITGDLDLSGTSAADDDTIFFDDGTKFLAWENEFDEFFFNAPLGVGGGLLVDDSMQLGGHFEITSTFLDTDYNRMGNTISNHGLNDNQDLFIGKSLEVDGPSWFDGQMTIAPTISDAGPLIIHGSSNGGLIGFHNNAGVFKGAIDIIGGTVTYGAFTGVHYAWTDEDLSAGMLVSMTGNNQYLGDASQSEIIYGITETSQKNDPSVLGTYHAIKTSSIVSKINDVHLVMVEGNGDVWIADMGQDIKPGDYLISSSVAGHAMKDDRSEELSHIIGRAAEPIVWSEVSDTIDDVKHKKISILFNFVPLNNN